MPRPAVRSVIRRRPPRAYLKFLKHAWRPFPTDEEAYWGKAAMKYLRHHASLRPDAFARLSDLNTTELVPKAEPSQILEWVNNDHLRRFEVKTELERAEGTEEMYQRWYIRAKSRHSIKGVDITTTRIAHAHQIGSLVFATTPEHWPLIEKHNGILPSIPNLHVPRLNNPNFTYFAQNLATIHPDYFSIYPARNNSSTRKHLIQLHIGINVQDAMNLGIKFFRNRKGQVLTTGLLTEEPYGRIPMEVFNDVFVVAMTRKMLHWGKQAKKPEEPNEPNEPKS